MPSYCISNYFKPPSLALRIVWVVALSVLLSGAVAAEAPVTVNLKEADIQALVATVADATGRNFVVDPRVTGQVTVIAPQPMGKDQLYQVFLSILEVHGFAAVPAGAVTKIVPKNKARQGGSLRLERGRGDELVTRVIQLQHVGAAQVVPMIRPLLAPEAHMAAEPESNVLVVSDSADNLDRLQQVIARIDRSSDSEIEVIPLQHASASELARVLKGLQSPAAGANNPGGTRLAADERTNSLLLGGDRKERLRLRALIGHLDAPLDGGGNTHVIYLRYAKADDLVPVLQGLSTTLSQDPAVEGGKPVSDEQVSIQADEAANAVVISAPPKIYQSLRRVIAQLDIRRAQVLVEAIIAEVSMDTVRELGVQWIVDGTPGGSGPVGLINFGGSTSIGDILTGVRTDALAVPQGALLGLGRFDSNSINFAALVSALANDASTNILSTPSVMTLDNQAAEIVVGQNVPFVTGEYASTGAANVGTVNPFRTIERRDIGLTLRVTPQINEGNAIKLDVQQEVSNIIPGAANAADLITSKRSIQTTVMVEDGRTVVLGGLIDDNLQQTKQKVPVLGDMPLLGPLFRFDRTAKVKQNLMVFLRPVIVRDAALQTQVTNGKYSYIRAQQIDARRQGVALLPENAAPLLPAHPVHLPHPFRSDAFGLEEGS